MVLVTPASVVAVGVTLPLLAAISVGLRFVVRRSRTAYIGVDDWLILFALVSGTHYFEGVAGDFFTAAS